MSTSFGERLGAAFERSGRLCVGVDPHEFLLREWGLPVDAAGAREFGLAVVDAAAGRAGIVKPQIAFFERFGAAGYAALEEVLAAARAAELLVIADVKRGDIGTTIEAYGQAWLTPGSPLEADAMTAVAFQGVGSLAAPLQLAARSGKGVLVLAATSNPEARAIQGAVLAESPTENSIRESTSESLNSEPVDGSGSARTVARAIIDDVTAFNAAERGPGLGPVGVVLGATLDLAEFGIDTHDIPALPVLAPGFGHQGARVEDASAIYGDLADGVIVSESRSLLAAGPTDLADAIARRAAEVRSALA